MIADINSERLQLAKEMGADVLINCKEVNLQEEGQAHYMFSRFLNLRISTKLFQENYLKFSIEIRNAAITVYHVTGKDTLQPCKKMKHIIS